VLSPVNINYPVTKQIEESRDMYSFLFWQLGVKPQDASAV